VLWVAVSEVRMYRVSPPASTTTSPREVNALSTVAVPRTTGGAVEEGSPPVPYP
jgi:hypothetical protein